ncbi:hypothetical protein TacPo2_20 [Pantoea bacteriophage TacPo2]
MNLSKIENKTDFLNRVQKGNFIVRKRGDVVLGFYKVQDANIRRVLTNEREFAWPKLFNFAKVFLVTGEIEPQKEAEPKFKRDSKFILWAPKSNLPPRVVLDEGIDHAMSVANDMARRHSGKFYVAHLVGVAEEKVTQRIVRDVTHESRML